MSRIPINRSQGRSIVLTTGGIVATEHPLASQAGATVLAAGGHAVDAAIAANAVMGVVCPMMCGVGGDLFAIVWNENERPVGVNASGWAPAALTRQYLAGRGHAGMPQSGPHSITVPGAVAGWGLLHARFGCMPLARLLEPAIAAADEGFPVAEITSEEWRNQIPFVAADAAAARTFLPGGAAPRLGEVFRNRDLAWTYRQIGAAGIDAFYQGEVAQRLLAGLERRGATLVASDLADYAAEWVEPVSTTYRGWTVFELPPNGAGIAALMMLNIMEQFDPALPDVDRLHMMIEAKKLAYADMLRYVADPRFVEAPVGAMLSNDYARERASMVDMTRAQPRVAAGALATAERVVAGNEGGDTTYLSVSDRQGNMVSLIQSNFASFGSGIVAEGTGFALQNRGALFTLDQDHPNALAPRKRPLHTIIPAFMSSPDTRIAFGIMGGWNQSQAHAQFVSNVVDRGMNVQAALEAPRFTKLTFDGNDVMFEQRFPAPLIQALAERGHDIERQGDYCSLMGGGQAVLRTAGVSYGGSDPRKDGCALPEVCKE